jgi:hypothetical protein
MNLSLCLRGGDGALAPLGYGERSEYYEPVTLLHCEPVTLSGGGALMVMTTRLHVEAGLAPGCFGGATAARQGSLAIPG